MADSTAERHVRFNDDPEGGWIVTGAPELPVEAHATTREGAVDEARKALEDIGGGVLYIHDTDGSVQQQQPVD